MKKIIAMLLCLVLLLSALTACTSAPETPAEPETPAVEPEETPVEEEPAEESAEEVPVEEEPAEEPAEETPVEENPAEEPAEEPEKEIDQTPHFNEALEILFYLDAIDARGRIRPKNPLTGAQADRMAVTFGLAEGSIDTALETVTGTQMLKLALQALGYDPAAEGFDSDEAVLAQADAMGLANGIFPFDAAANLTFEQGCQIMLNAMSRSTVSYDSGAAAPTGAPLSDAVGLTHMSDPEYADFFNRPGSYWVKTGTEEVVGQKYPATPVAIFSRQMTWCEVLVALGYPEDDLDRNFMKTFQNSNNGEEYTVKFEKCHWGNDAGPHAGCGTDPTSENSMTLEVYQISDTEYRNIYYTNFLAEVKDGAISLYGYNAEVWGPWPNEGLPADGYYMVHYAWNAYGLGETFEIVCPATAIYGELNASNDYNTLIDGVKYSNAMVFNLGADIAKAVENQNAGKSFTFLLDQYGYVIGCIDGEI